MLLSDKITKVNFRIVRVDIYAKSEQVIFRCVCVQLNTY